jgi:stearoyl-CoA desaturase (delta-9 desaturase)
MIWIPVMATGIINGIGHYWGYRNFEAPDASTNVSPWGIMIGGEELHNNHHTYPTSAKFSVKPYEFDIGWVYIRLMELIGWAKVRKTPPKLQLGDIKPVADDKTLEALIANRYEVMAKYAREMRRACKAEIERLKAGAREHASLANASGQALAAPRRRQDPGHGAAAAGPGPCSAAGARQAGDHARRAAPALDTHQVAEQLVADLQAWCRRPKTAASRRCSSSR